MRSGGGFDSRRGLPARASAGRWTGRPHMRALADAGVVSRGRSDRIGTESTLTRARSRNTYTGYEPRRRGRRQLGILVALALIAGGGYGAYSVWGGDAEENDPQVTAAHKPLAAFLAAWERHDAKGAAGHTDTPDNAASLLASVLTNLKPSRTTIVSDSGRKEEDGEVRFPFSVAMEVPGAGKVTWRSRAEVNRISGTWKVAFTSPMIHPELEPGQTLALKADDTRAKVLDSQGHHCGPRRSWAPSTRSAARAPRVLRPGTTRCSPEAGRRASPLSWPTGRADSLSRTSARPGPPRAVRYVPPSTHASRRRQPTPWPGRITTRPSSPSIRATAIFWPRSTGPAASTVRSKGATRPAPRSRWSPRRLCSRAAPGPRTARPARSSPTSTASASRTRGSSRSRPTSTFADVFAQSCNTYFVNARRPARRHRSAGCRPGVRDRRQLGRGNDHVRRQCAGHDE